MQTNFNSEARKQAWKQFCMLSDYLLNITHRKEQKSAVNFHRKKEKCISFFIKVSPSRKWINFLPLKLKFLFQRAVEYKKLNDLRKREEAGNNFSTGANLTFETTTMITPFVSCFHPFSSHESFHSNHFEFPSNWVGETETTNGLVARNFSSLFAHNSLSSGRMHTKLLSLIWNESFSDTNRQKAINAALTSSYFLSSLSLFSVKWHFSNLTLRLCWFLSNWHFSKEAEIYVTMA